MSVMAIGHYTTRTTDWRGGYAPGLRGTLTPAGT